MTLLDASALIVGMVAAKNDVICDFLDDSVVAFETADSKGELKTTDIAPRAPLRC